MTPVVLLVPTPCPPRLDELRVPMRMARVTTAGRNIRTVGIASEGRAARRAPSMQLLPPQTAAPPRLEGKERTNPSVINVQASSLNSLLRTRPSTMLQNRLPYLAMAMETPGLMVDRGRSSHAMLMESGITKSSRETGTTQESGKIPVRNVAVVVFAAEAAIMQMVATITILNTSMHSVPRASISGHSKTVDSRITGFHSDRRLWQTPLVCTTHMACRISALSTLGIRLFPLAR